MKGRLTFAALILVIACVLHAGPGPDSYQPAHSANGVTASLAVATTTIDGELLEVQDTAVVILTLDRVALIPFRAISSGRFEGSPVTIANNQRPFIGDLTAIRLVSRYPQGIPPQALRRMLRSKSQDSITLIR
jgi:hypothetical protein